MEISSTLIGIIIFLLCASPIAYIIINSVGSQKKIKKAFTALCIEKGMVLKEFEVIGKTVIGMDTTLKNVFFATSERPKETFEAIPITTLNSCYIRTHKPKNKPTELVELELAGDGYKKEVVFYREDDEESGVTDSDICLHRARKWERLIKEQLQ